MGRETFVSFVLVLSDKATVIGWAGSLLKFLCTVAKPIMAQRNACAVWLKHGLPGPLTTARLRSQ